MENIIIKREGGRARAYALGAPLRITSHLGTGTLRYLTDDGYLGVALDGERTVDGRPRVDEIHVDHLLAA